MKVNLLKVKLLRSRNFCPESFTRCGNYRIFLPQFFVEIHIYSKFFSSNLFRARVKFFSKKLIRRNFCDKILAAEFRNFHDNRSTPKFGINGRKHILSLGTGKPGTLYHLKSEIRVTSLRSRNTSRRPSSRKCRVTKYARI